MTPFTVKKLPEIYFGEGRFEELPRLIIENARRVLLITGDLSFCGTPMWEDLVGALSKSAVAYFHASVKKEPSPELIDEIVFQFKAEKPDLIVSIGGGSVIDAGKAVSAMILKNDSVKNYLEGFMPALAHDGAKIPFIAVPTTAGTGSEATKNAVLSQVGTDGFKRSIRHDNFVPDIALVDPELMRSCPPSITASCGMDAFVQLLESYVSIQSTEWTDALSFSGMRQVSEGLVGAYQDGNNLEARDKMAYGALMSGITLAHAGLGIVHGFASSLGGFFNIAHGVICGTLLGAATRINIQSLKETNDKSAFLDKYARVGALLSQRQYLPEERQENLDRLIQKIDQWLTLLNIPKLGAFGVTRTDVDRIAAHTENKNNPAMLTKDQIKQIIAERL